MKTTLLAVLACPSCGKRLDAAASTRDGDEIIEGSLACAGCGAGYPIRNGIPRFVPTDAYVDTFSFEWTTFHDVQVDILNRTDLSEREFRGKTGWGPGDLKGKFVLDAGVGAGRFAEIASRWGAEVVGVDLSFAVDAARDTLRGRDNVHIVQADIFHLPFRRETFDAAYSMGVLHHTPDTKEAFRSVASLVKTGGEFAVFIYGYGPHHYFSDIWRRLTTRIPYKLVYSLSFLSIPLYYVYKIPLLGLALQLVFPISRHPSPRWRWLNTFDWYSPTFQHKHTWPDVSGWFEDNGFGDVRLYQESRATAPGNINVRGRRTTPRTSGDNACRHPRPST